MNHHSLHKHFCNLISFTSFKRALEQRPPSEREEMDEEIFNFQELLMITVARLDTALAANAAKDTEITDLKTQVTTLQGQVANVPSAEVMAKTEQLVTALAGPDVTAAP